MEAGAQIWYAAGTWLLAVVSGATFFSAVIAYTRSKRTDSARLAKDLYEKWFFDPTLSAFRRAIEDHDTWHRLTQPALLVAAHEQRPSRWRRTRRSHASRLAVVDAGLNYLEFIIQMKEEASLVDRHLDSFLLYWVDSLMRIPSRSALREYIFRWGWRAIQDRLLEATAASYFDEVVLLQE